MHKEAIRHHYIPQFILRNFSKDGVHVYYKSSFTNVIKKVEICNIFMEQNLYRDEINYCENPTKIELDLARYENEVSKIIKDKILDKKRILLSQEESDSLKLFFAIMSFRSQNTKENFEKNFSIESKKFYSQIQKNGNMNDLWKRNLGAIVNCRSLKEVISNKEIDEPFKIFMKRDTEGMIGSYFVFCEKRGPIDFIISDGCPIFISCEGPNGIKIPVYSYFPLSSNIIMINVYNQIRELPQSILRLDKEIFKYPKKRIGDIIEYNVMKLYKNDVLKINKEVIENAKKGIVFKDFIE